MTFAPVANYVSKRAPMMPLTLTMIKVSLRSATFAIIGWTGDCSRPALIMFAWHTVFISATQMQSKNKSGDIMLAS
jgi:hypothetical protein